MTLSTKTEISRAVAGRPRAMSAGAPRGKMGEPARDLPTSALLQSITDKARLIAGARYAALGLFDQRGAITRFLTSGMSPAKVATLGEFLKGRGLLAYLKKHVRPLRLPDMTVHSASVGFLPNHPPMKSLLGVPIRSGRSCLGILYLTNKRGAQEFTQEDEERMVLFASLAYVAIENDILSHEARERTREIEATAAIARIVTSNFDLNEVYERFARKVRKVVPFDRMAINLIDESQGTFLVAYLSGESSVFRQGESSPLKGSATALVVRNGRPHVTREFTRTRGVSTDRLWAAEGFHSALRVPLVAQDRVSGVVSLISRQPDTYGPGEARFMERLASYIAPAIENFQLFQRVRQLALAAATIGDGVCVTDPEGCIEFVNPALEQMLGYERGELVDRPVADLYPGGSSDPMLQKIMAALLSGGWSGEAELLAKSGDMVTTQETATPMRDEDGRLVGYVYVNADITERKRAEKEIKRLQELNDRIIASTSYGLMVLTRNLEVAFANPTFYQLSGLKRAAVEGKRIAEIRQLEGLAELAAEAIRSRKSPLRRELIYSLPNGARCWFAVAASPLHGDEEAAVLLTLADITERKQAQEKIQGATRLIALGELVAGVAHELNNPLTAVLGYTQLLEADDLSEPHREYVKEILAQTQRSIHVVQNLLSFARKHEPEKAPVDVAEAVERVLAIKGRDLKLNNIKVETAFSSGPLCVMGDQHRLQEVFLNIVTNAEQAMTEAHRGGSLLIRGSTHRLNGAKRSRDVIRISFTDSGPGIAPEDQNRIFDQFFTTKEPGKGTGLGLSICRTLVRAQGGKIWVESEVGKGATIHVELPVCAAVESTESRAGG